MKTALKANIVLAFIGLLAFLSPLSVGAEVPYTYWAPGGVVLDLRTGNDEVNHHTAISDGNGGAYAAWIRSYFGIDQTEVFVQRVNGNGVAQWTANGLKITNLGEIQTEPQLVSDGVGGVIVAWLQYDGVGQTEIYAQRVNSSGVLQWGDGVSVTQSMAASKDDIRIVSDGANGAVITWLESRDTAIDIFAQRITSDGNRAWGAEGSIVYQDTINNVLFHRTVSDGSGGIFVSWSQNQRGDVGAFFQHLDSTGAQQAPAQGEMINDYANTQFIQGMVSDNAGGAIVIWEDERDSRHIYAQRLLSSNSLAWDAGGVLISDVANVSFGLFDGIAADGVGGAIITWDESDDGVLRAQRINASGVAQWGAEGIRVVQNGVATNISLINTNTSDMIAVWDYLINVGSDEYYNLNAQYISSDGQAKWGENGLTIYQAATGGNNINLPKIVNDGDIGGIVVWSPDDLVTGNYYEVKIQGVSHAYQIANLDAELDSLDADGNNIELGTVNGVVGTDELVRIKTTSDNLIVSDVLADMVQDHNWSGVDADSDAASGKAVVTGLESAPGANTTHTLYIPFRTGDSGVTICPNATTLAEVTSGCTGAVTFSEGQTKPVGGDTVTVSKVTIASQVYWAAAGVTGTGGFSTADAGLPATGSNIYLVVTSALALIVVSTASGVYAMSKKRI